jgi:hypothetical protein
MKMKIFILLTIISSIFFSTSCSNNATATSSAFTPQDSGYPAPLNNAIEGYPGSDVIIKPGAGVPTPPTTAPDPEPGKASISGVLYSFTSDLVLADTQFYLTLGWGEDHTSQPLSFIGPMEEIGDIFLKSDMDGYFYINNIPPGNYYLAVMAPYNWAAAVISDTNVNLRLIQLKEGDKVQLGVVYVSWP